MISVHFFVWVSPEKAKQYQQKRQGYYFINYAKARKL
jgi:hypothetical protein